MMVMSIPLLWAVFSQMTMVSMICRETCKNGAQIGIVRAITVTLQHTIQKALTREIRVFIAVLLGVTTISFW